MARVKFQNKIYDYIIFHHGTSWGDVAYSGDAWFVIVGTYGILNEVCAHVTLERADAERFADSLLGHPANWQRAGIPQ